MSVSPTQAQIDAFGYHGLLMGADDFLSLGQSRERYELVHGVVCMSPRPTTYHQRLLSLIQFQLETFIRENPGNVYFPDVDLVLNKETVYAPDLVCYRPGRIPELPLKLDVPPDLVIEILSYGTKAFDLTTKHNDYERFGVGEYWTYDPADKTARAFRRRQGRFTMTSVPEDHLPSEALPGFILDLGPLRQLGS